MWGKCTRLPRALSLWSDRMLLRCGGDVYYLCSWYNTRPCNPLRPDAKSNYQSILSDCTVFSSHFSGTGFKNQQGCYWNQESKDYQAILSTGSFQAKQMKRETEWIPRLLENSACPSFFTGEDTQRFCLRILLHSFKICLPKCCRA